MRGDRFVITTLVMVVMYFLQPVQSLIFSVAGGDGVALAVSVTIGIFIWFACGVTLLLEMKDNRS